MVTIAVNPYLDRNFAPIREKITTDKLPVIGELPLDLSGIFVRNGPNPQWTPIGQYHWFDGERIGIAEGRIGIAEGRISIAEGRIGIVEGRIGIAEGRIGIAEGRIGIAEGRIGIVEGCIGIVEGCIGIAKFNSLRINQMLY